MNKKALRAQQWKAKEVARIGHAHRRRANKAARLNSDYLFKAYLYKHCETLAKFPRPRGEVHYHEICPDAIPLFVKLFLQIGEKLVPTQKLVSFDFRFVLKLSSSMFLLSMFEFPFSEF